MSDETMPRADAVKAGKMTAKKYVEDAGQGIWWGSMSKARREAVAAYLRCDDRADIEARLAASKARTLAAEGELKALDVATAAKDEALAWCASMTETANRPVKS